MSNIFTRMETDISDTATAAQILATLFEDQDMRHVQSGNPNRPLTIDVHEADMIRFMIYDMCKRTNELKKQFYSLVKDDAALRGQDRKAA